MTPSREPVVAAADLVDKLGRDDGDAVPDSDGGTADGVAAGTSEGGRTTDGRAGRGAPALEVDHVSASYGPYRALFDVTFTVPESGITALIGSNGAGKSTVSRVVTGLLASTEGTIRLSGKDVTGLPAYKIARSGAAHVPEGRGVFANLTVEENLKLAFRQRGGRQSVSGLARAGLRRLPGPRGSADASTGERCPGVSSASCHWPRCWWSRPDLLVADEISLGLAPVMIDAVYDGLRRINDAGTALLIVEQQVDRVLEIARTAVVLEHGTVAYSGSSDGALAAVERVLASRGERTLSVAEPHQNGSAPG